MKAYIINLDSSKERMRRMECCMRQLELDFERMPAIDDRKLPESEFRELCASEFQPVPGQLGCFLSHRACWERIAESPEPFAIVLEDDVAFAKNAGPLLRDPGFIPEGIGLVRLEAWNTKTSIENARIPLSQGYALHRLRGNITGAAGYAITKEKAALLLDRCRTYTVPLDFRLFHDETLRDEMRMHQLIPAALCQLRFVSPALAALSLAATTIGEEGFINPRDLIAKPRKTALDRVRNEVQRVARKLRHRQLGISSVVVDLHPVGPMEEGVVTSDG